MLLFFKDAWCLDFSSIDNQKFPLTLTSCTCKYVVVTIGDLFVVANEGAYPLDGEYILRVSIEKDNEIIGIEREIIIKRPRRCIK